MRAGAYGDKTLGDIVDKAVETLIHAKKIMYSDYETAQGMFRWAAQLSSKLEQQIEKDFKRRVKEGE